LYYQCSDLFAFFVTQVIRNGGSEFACGVWLRAVGCGQVESFSGNDMALQTLVGRETLHRMVGLLSSCERQVAARCACMMANIALGRTNPPQDGEG
jgi:hypothetical protein